MKKLKLYAYLMRLHQPIGILLLLWPTLMALWLASDGHPNGYITAIFVIGTLFIRTAGCIINDYIDCNFDKYVKRTFNRPLTTGKIKKWEAITIIIILTILSFILIIKLNLLTKYLSFGAMIIIISYPYFKRFFAIPQLCLGIAFSFSILMSFAAIQNKITTTAWLMFIANIFWVIAYDTEYAMVDRNDDLKLGIKTSAITFGSYDILGVMLCYITAISLFWLAGWQHGLHTWFNLGMFVAISYIPYHYQLIRLRNRIDCFTAFMHNNWVGATMFSGIILNYILK